MRIKTGCIQGDTNHSIARIYYVLSFNSQRFNCFMMRWIFQPLIFYISVCFQKKKNSAILGKMIFKTKFPRWSCSQCTNPFQCLYSFQRYFFVVMQQLLLDAGIVHQINTTENSVAIRSIYQRPPNTRRNGRMLNAHTRQDNRIHSINHLPNGPFVKKLNRSVSRSLYT